MAKKPRNRREADRSNFRGREGRGGKMRASASLSGKKDSRKDRGGEKQQPSAKSILNKPLSEARKKISVPESLRRQAASIDFTKITLPDRSAVPETVADGVVALHEETSGAVVDFDAALEKLKQTEAIEPSQEIVYIGSGNFAVVSHGKNADGKPELVIHRKIEFEKRHDDLAWRDKLCYDLALAYTPNPDPLSELYTTEEILNFPAFRKP